MTGYLELGEPPAARSEHLSEEQLAAYRHLTEIQTNANITTQLLATAFSLSDASQIEPLRERFEAAAGQIEASLKELGGSRWQEAGLEQLFSNSSIWAWEQTAASTWSIRNCN